MSGELRMYVIAPYLQDFKNWANQYPGHTRPTHVHIPAQLMGLELAECQIVKLRHWEKTGITQGLINSRIRITSPPKPLSNTD